VRPGGLIDPAQDGFVTEMGAIALVTNSD